jgi:hypothetical protein
MKVIVHLLDIGRASVSCEASWLDRVLFGRRSIADVVTRDPWAHDVWYWSTERRVTNHLVLDALVRAVARQHELERSAQLQRGAYP